jgi:hypothetical protein
MGARRTVRGKEEALLITVVGAPDGTNPPLG